MGYLRNTLNRRTFAYRFSIKDKMDTDLINLKKLIHADNKNWGAGKRVRLMARGGDRGRTYSTPHANATSFDVYVHNK